jgi:8-oxo-dGTP diphosphatase
MKNAYHKFPVSVNLLLIKDNSLLLSLRGGSARDQNLWGLIAGHLETGESITSCAKREAKEELGIDIDINDLTAISTMYGNNPEYIGLFFTCDKWSGEIKNMEAEKSKQLGFFSLDSLPQDIVPYMKKGIECFKQKIIFSEYIR